MLCVSPTLLLSPKKTKASKKGESRMKIDLSLDQLRVLAEFARQNNDNDTIVQIREAIEKIETAARIVK